MATKGKAGEGSKRTEEDPKAISPAAKREVTEEKEADIFAATHDAAPVELQDGGEVATKQPLVEGHVLASPPFYDPSAVEESVDEAPDERAVAEELKEMARGREAASPDVEPPTLGDERPHEKIVTDREEINRERGEATMEMLREFNEHEAPATGPCDPCSDLIDAAKRVIRDPKVTKNVGDLLLGVAKRDWGSDSLADAGKAALTSFAKAVAGRDAVPAKGERCRGQVRLLFAFLDPKSADGGISRAIKEFQEELEFNSAEMGRHQARRTQLIAPEVLKSIKFQLLDEKLRIADEGTRTYDSQGGILISEVEAGSAYVSLPADIFGGAEIVDDFLATDPGGNTLTHYTRVRPTVGCPLALACPDGDVTLNTPYNLPLVASGGMPPYTFSVVGDLPNGLDKAIGTGPITVLPRSIGSFHFQVKVTDSNSPMGIATANCNIDCFDCGDEQQRDHLLKRGAFVPPSTSTGPKRVHGFGFRIGSGLKSIVVLFLKPPVAQVRCFSLMEGDDSCGEGKQYISRVAISAIQGDELVACKPTGESGCSGFRLNPGMYTFSAPREITIHGCNYMLASSSPITAYLGAGQKCSDIYFSYKKKGSEIQVISEISSALGGDPYKTSRQNFPGMNYLLLREGDQAFAQQQKTTDGGVVSFPNLTAGTYMLFCQGPDEDNSPVVTPVYPPNGRLSLRVFTGQTSTVPILVKFRTSTTKPAKLVGYVRDATGQPVPQQVVEVLDYANCLVAAGLTDVNGLYSIQIYAADNLTIRVGTQLMPVSKSQIQTAMQTVGTPALPAPGSILDLAVQTSELVREF
jgi:hypothetical protein